MHKILAPERKWFTAWQRRTGETAPDFAALRRFADLPPLLEFYDGRRLTSPRQWPARRAEILQLLQHWFWGALPATPPVLRIAVLRTEEQEHGCIRRQVEVRFVHGEKEIPVTLELLVPHGPGPFPVFLTQTTHRSWAVLGLARGYLGCVYPAADEDDQSARFLDAYPDCDWTTIPRRAWLAGRALDYLFTLPEVDRRQVVLTGHSRNGKQALIAAAIDERITAVVSSSSGAGGASPYRFTSEREFLESVECTTWMCPDWFHPRLRFFTGREQFLPIDTHGYLALIAPRHCLISTALNDGCEGTFGVERAYREAQKVYRLLKHPEALRIRWRPGGHETRAEDIHSYFDWFDRALGRGSAEFPEVPLHYFDWRAWRRKNGGLRVPPPVAPRSSEEEKRQAVRWSLGEEPPGGVDWRNSYGSERDHDAKLMDRLGTPEGVVRLPVQFGEYLAGDLYYPAKVTASLPVVIWLHPPSHPQGYRGSYVVEHDSWKPYCIFHTLAQAGYACFAFDQLGFGRRIHEGTGFYRRFPRWSQLGQMVRDVRAAVDFLRDGEHRSDFPLHPVFQAHLPPLNTSRIFCLGYSLGGLVALYATALDARIAGLASFCGFTPMRVDTDTGPTGGIRRLWEWYGLQPRLGLLAGREKDIPFDFHDLLALVAPRPCLVVAPTFDRDSDPTAVRECRRLARRVWARSGAAKALTFLLPEDYSRFQPDQYQVFLQWFQKAMQ